MIGLLFTRTWSIRRARTAIALWTREPAIRSVPAPTSRRCAPTGTVVSARRCPPRVVVRQSQLFLDQFLSHTAGAPQSPCRRLPGGLTANRLFRTACGGARGDSTTARLTEHCATTGIGSNSSAPHSVTNRCGPRDRWSASSTPKSAALPSVGLLLPAPLARTQGRPGAAPVRALNLDRELPTGPPSTIYDQPHLRT